MPFLHIERYESIAHCGELLSATRGVLQAVIFAERAK